MGKVEHIASLLKGKEWKNMEDIECNCSLPRDIIEDILDFLDEYNFLEKNEMNNTFRLIPKLRALLEAS
jgi:predicted transcriptional regulator